MPLTDLDSADGRDSESSASYVSSSLTPKQQWHSLRSVWPVAAKVHSDRTAGSHITAGGRGHCSLHFPEAEGRMPCNADSSEHEPHPIRASPTGRASHQDWTGRPPDVQAPSGREGGACSAPVREECQHTASGPVSGGQHPHLAGQTSDPLACTPPRTPVHERGEHKQPWRHGHAVLLYKRPGNKTGALHHR